MTTISEAEFERICDQLRADRASIIKHNPIGPDDEVLLWMLLNTLTLYLNLTDLETPCFTTKPNADTYNAAIQFVLNERKADAFDAKIYIDRLLA